jgi:hypothetical protein
MDLEEAMEEMEGLEESALLSDKGFQNALEWLDKLGVANRSQINRIRDFLRTTAIELEDKRATVTVGND